VLEAGEALGRYERVDQRPAVGDNKRRQLQKETVRTRHVMVALQSHMPGGPAGMRCGRDGRRW
jgi:hypothetical protein